MAFVFETERRINVPSKLGNPLGPGQYHNLESAPTPHDSAPFKSSCIRKSMFDQKGRDKPGPGDYEISQPIIEPNIKSVSNSHSIILKINSTGTAQFKSTNVRFHDSEGDGPGPGQYEFPGIEGRKPEKRQSYSRIVGNLAAKRLRELNNSAQVRNYPTIPERTRGLTDITKEKNPTNDGKVGPGFYEPSKTVHVNSTGAVWGKDRTKRFVPERTIPLGPGQYRAEGIQTDDKSSLSAGHFRSQTVRTYFDNLIYKTNVESTAEERAKNHYRPRDPAPGQYETNPSSFQVKNKPFSFQFFGSTVERFPEEQQAGKYSFYHIKSVIGDNRSFNRGKRPFDSELAREPTFLQVDDRENVPGPGEYKERVVVEKKLKAVKVQKFGSTTDRPFFQPEKKDEIGPGKYDQGENVEEFIKNRFGQIKNESSNFKSSTDRKCFGDITSDGRIGEYDLSYNDVAKKLERQRIFLENLKKIDVEKAPFESSISRFPHYEGKNSPLKEREARVNLNKQQELRIKQEAERARSVVIQSNRSQVVEQRDEKGMFDKQERFKELKKGAPGVGAYAMRDSWERKSHNVKYQKGKK